MGIGASVFLIAVGAIIAFALEARVGWLDLDVVGWVMMLAGVFGLVLTLGVFNRRRQVVATRQSSTYGAPPAPVAPVDVPPQRTVVETPPQRTVVDTPGQRAVVDQPQQWQVTEYEEIERPL